MMIKAKELLHELTVNVAGALIFAILTALVTATITFVPTLKKIFFNNLKDVIIYCLIVIIGLFAFIHFYRRKKYYSVYVDKDQIRFYYELYEINFTIVNKFKSISETHVQFRSKEDISEFPVNITWTGNSCELTALTHGAEVVKNTCKSEKCKWTIYLPRKFKKGELIDLKYQITLHDDKQTAVPFLQYNVNRPTKKVKLQVSFPSEINISCIAKQSYIANTDYVKESLLYDDNLKSYTYEPKHPQLLDTYRMDWKIEKNS